ncbi:MAG: LysR family transcriptional regulator [Amphritea sp.]
MATQHSRLPNLTDFDIRLLRVFHAVVQSKGFAAAQDKLGLTQSTISIQIAQLEGRLNVRLCERGRKGFYLTEEGRMVYEASLSLFRAVESFRGLVGSALGQLVGEMHFGIVDALVTNPEIDLDKALRAFADVAPDVELHIDVSSPQELIQGLIEEHYHAILTPVSRQHSSIKYRSAFKEQQTLYCGQDHPLFDRPASGISVDDLSNIAYSARAYMLDWTPPLELELQPKGMASHMESIALMILSGRFIGYLPTHYASNWVTADKMRPLLKEQLSYDEQFYVCSRKAEPSRVAQAFLRCIEEHMCNGGA